MRIALDIRADLWNVPQSIWIMKRLEWGHAYAPSERKYGAFEPTTLSTTEDMSLPILESPPLKIVRPICRLIEKQPQTSFSLVRRTK